MATRSKFQIRISIDKMKISLSLKEKVRVMRLSGKQKLRRIACQASKRLVALSKYDRMSDNKK